MKFKYYLKEERRIFRIYTDKFYKLLDTDFSYWYEQYKRGNSIYRGDSFHSYRFGLIDPSKVKPRKSRNTKNYYTLLFDHILPSWKKMPSRSRGIICATDIHIAASFGIPMVIIPKNGAKIGVCSDRDLWDSFKNFMNLEFFVFKLDKLFNHFKISVNDSDWKSLKAGLEQLDEYIKNINLFSYDISIANIIRDLTIKNTSLLKSLDILLDPKNNGIKVGSHGKLPRGREVWTDSPCLYVDIDFIEKRK